ncbi:MAG TPA: hypothetical protein VJT31_14915 [Rugosimonospora sp.]|nr:hypothetical protein [Rugosimonospora sp.]
MILAYGFANLLQSVAAARTRPEERFHPSLLLRLAGDWCYVVGVGFQFLGFALAFFARRELPLFLVQAAVAAGLGVTAVLGVVLLKWRLPAAELVLLGALCVGVTGLIVAAQPGESRHLGFGGDLGLAVAVGLIAVAGLFTVRLRGALGSVALGSLAGLAFGAAAVASRPLAAAHSWDRFVADPLLYLLVAHTVVGQLLLGLAMQRGSTTAAVAAMDAASAAPAAVVGLLLLGDRIWPGREWLAGLGFLITLGTVVLLTRYAQPQHHHAHNGRRARRSPLLDRIAA